MPVSFKKRLAWRQSEHQVVVYILMFAIARIFPEMKIDVAIVADDARAGKTNRKRRPLSHTPDLNDLLMRVEAKIKAYPVVTLKFRPRSVHLCVGRR